MPLAGQSAPQPRRAAVHAAHPRVAPELAALAGRLYVCPIGELEQLYSARSAEDYDALKADLPACCWPVETKERFRRDASKIRQLCLVDIR